MQVPIGPSSWLGWLTFAAGELTAGLVALTGSEAQLHGPGKWAALGGLASLALTNAGRQLQAFALARAGSSSAPTSRPQSAATPDGAATSGEGEPL